MIDNPKDFYGLGIAPGILGVLNSLKFVEPTPIQTKCIPLAVEGKDLIGIAQTGTGKTLAFGIPVIQRALQDRKGGTLIVLPTRELALQVQEALTQVGRSLGIRTALLIGGASMSRQIADIRRGPDIVIGTPGRIIDNLEHQNLSLANVRTLVLDEADRMLDMGFAPQLKKILQAVPEDRQTLLFSATMPPTIASMARAFMKLPLQIEVAPSGTVADKVTQEVFMVGREQKTELLKKLLRDDYRGSVLVFVRTKHAASRLTRQIRVAGHGVAELHSNRSLNQRKEALEGFKHGKYRVLVATDIAARGIDVTNIELVVNYDLPEQTEDYVHRIGRTARAGASGHAISFATLSQITALSDIERLLRERLTVSKLPDCIPEPAFEQAAPARSRRPNFNRRPFSRNRRFARR